MLVILTHLLSFLSWQKIARKMNIFLLNLWYRIILVLVTVWLSISYSISSLMIDKLIAKL